MSRSAKWFSVLSVVCAVLVYCVIRLPIVSAQAGGPSYNSDGKLVQPQGFRHWKFIGAMVTPNGLNGGKAGFPEFHNVYVEQANFDAYEKNGVFPEGTVIVKELTLTRNATYPDGSTNEASGRGFFEGEPNGMDVTVKDSKRYAATNNWGFYNFGHHAQPYAESAQLAARESCAGCHMAGASKTDMTWVQFYPNLRSKN
jgi:hypothetical protein